VQLKLACYFSAFCVDTSRSYW